MHATQSRSLPLGAPFYVALFVALVVALLAGCAQMPQTPPLELARERGEVVEVGRFSQKAARSPLPDYWRPYIILPGKPRTEYALVNTSEGVALEANSEASASGLVRRIRIDPRSHPVLTWRWRIEDLIPGADMRLAHREDSPARLMVSFHGDAKNLDFVERSRMRMAKALSGSEVPYATLMYVVANDLPVGTVIPNPHTERVQMIVVASGAQQAGEWLEFRRDVLADYRRAFGEEPWDIVAVGVMTDSDNTGKSARCHYGDISFLERPAR